MTGRAAGVVVVGAGIAGVACARELAAGGIPVTVRDRGHKIGGRMAVRTVQGRPIDIGASYFTVSDPAFGRVVRDWLDRGLARPWTTTFHTAAGSELGPVKPGPQRYGSLGGLRSLVADLAADLEVASACDVADVVAGRAGPVVDGRPAAAVVLAMPDAQAHDLLGWGLDDLAALLADRSWKPSLALYAGWDRRCWPELDGVFVNGSPVLGFVADDGRRRGDGAPVLVAHSTAGFAEPVLDQPQSGLAPMVAAVRDLLDIPDPPAWAGLQRWSLARPAQARSARYFLDDTLVGVCGDGWGSPRVQTAYLSGRALGCELVERLG